MAFLRTGCALICAAVILMTSNPMRWDDPFYIEAFTQQERGINALLVIYARDVREVAKAKS